jgi:hypothetical protein
MTPSPVHKQEGNHNDRPYSPFASMMRMTAGIQ